MKKFTLKLLGVLTLLLSGTLPAFARTFSYTHEGQTLTYTVIDEAAKTCKTNDGYYFSAASSYSPGNKISGSLVIPAKVFDGTDSLTVTELGEYAFAACTGLTSINLPNSLTSIGKSAFQVCTGLTSIVLPDGMTSIGEYAFCRCTGLTSIVLPDGMTSIGQYAFYGCTGLTSIVLPDGMTSIGEYAFSRCTGLTSIVLPDSMTSISKGLFDSCTSLTSVKFPKEVYSIYKYAFNGCSSLISIDLNLRPGVYSAQSIIDPEAFRYCKGLTSVCLKSSKRGSCEEIIIYENAFSDCPSIKELNLLGAYSTIKSGNFTNCQFESVVIPYASNGIGSNTFTSTNLKKIAYPQNYTLDASITSNPAIYAYQYNSSTEISDGKSAYTKDGETLTFAPATTPDDVFHVTSTVKTVGADAFKNSHVATLYIDAEPNSTLHFLSGCADQFASIYMDRDCVTDDKSPLATKLNSVTFSQNVTSIAENAFNSCAGINYLNIPESVTEIGVNAFANMPDLKRIYAHGTTPAAIDANAFSGLYDKVPVVVDNGDAYYAYKTDSNWRQFANLNYNLINPNSEYINFGDLIYRFIDNKNVEVVRSDSYSALSDVVVPDSIFKTVEEITADGDTIPRDIYYAVTRIADHAFTLFDNISSVSIGNSVTEIADGAFKGCSSLATVALGENIATIGQNAFKNCENLTSLIDSYNSLAHIGDNAFIGCQALKEVNFGDNISYIGAGAFADNSVLATVSFGKGNNAVIKNGAFKACSALADITLGDGYVAVGDSAFYACSAVAAVNLGKNIATIGNHAFNGCSNLTSVKYSDVLTTISDYAFKGCSAMKSFQCGDKIRYIGKEAFADAAALASVSFGKGDNAVIADGAFRGCSALTAANLGDGYLSIGNNAFQGCSKLATLNLGSAMKNVGDYAFQACSKLTKLTVEKSVESIGDMAFSGATLLATLTIPVDGNLKRIGARTFEGIRIQHGIDLPNSLECLGDSAFYNVRRLSTLSLPDNAKFTMGNYAFAQCQALTDVSSKGSFTSVGNSAFEGCVKLTKAEILAGEIGEKAMAGCSLLESVKFSGDGTVHTNALLNCVALTDAVIDASNIETKVAEGCTALTNLDLSGRVETIGAYAFNDTNLSNVQFGTKLKSIGNYAFNNCKIAHVEFPSVDTPEPHIVIGRYAFYANPVDEIIFGNRVKTVNEYAFPYGDKSICDFGQSVEEILGLDYNNKATTIFPGTLKNVTLSTTILYSTYVEFEKSSEILNLRTNSTRSGISTDTLVINRPINADKQYGHDVYSAPRKCLIFPDSEQPFIDEREYKLPLRDYYSYGNTGYINITIPEVYIGSSVKALTNQYVSAINITFAEGIEYITENWLAYSGKLEPNRKLVLPVSLQTVANCSDMRWGKEIVFKDSDKPLSFLPATTTLKNTTAENIYVGRTLSSNINFSNVKTAVFGNEENPIDIPAGIFKNNTVLENAVLSDNVRNIGEEAFYGCSTLKVIEFPSNIESLGNNAYTGCTGLERIVARSVEPYDGDVSFDSEIEDNVPLYVPDGSEDDYYMTALFGWFNINPFSDNVAESVNTDEVDPLYDPIKDDKIDVHHLGKVHKQLHGHDKHHAPARRSAAATADDDTEADPVEEFYYFSPRPDIATVDQNGVVTILKEEPCEIWVYALDGSGVKAVFNVNNYIPGDGNRDKVLDIADINVMVGHVSAPEGSTLKIKLGDITKDGDIDIQDINVLCKTIENE